MSTTLTVKSDRKNSVGNLVHAFALAGAGIAGISLPGEDVLALRAAEVLLIAYLAYGYRVPFLKAFVKGVGISGWATLVGMGITDIATAITGGTATPLRVAMAAALIESCGWMAINKFSKDGNEFLAKCFDAFSVAGFIYDLKCLIKLCLLPEGPSALPPEKAIPYKEIKETSPVFKEFIQSEEMSPLLKDKIALKNIAMNLPESFIVPGCGRAVAYGHPGELLHVLDAYQGDNSFHVDGCCGINSIVNALRRLGYDYTENNVLGYALEHGLCDPDGATSSYTIATLLERLCKNGEKITLHNGIRGIPFKFKKASVFSPEQIGNAIKEGYQAIIGINSSLLNGLPQNPGCVDHAVAVTGAVFDTVGKFLGLFVCDSGVGTAMRFLSAETLEHIYTLTRDSCCVLVK